MNQTEEVIENGTIVRKPLSHRVWMTLPLIGAEDELRHKNWNHRAQNEGYPLIGTLRNGDLGHCACLSNTQ
jgi:hypothetical protein